MYTEFFGLRELPFNNTPDPRFFYPTPDHEEALASLIYAVKERKGFVLLTGEVGAGKTLVSRMMLRQLGTSIAFANLNHAVASPRELMESLCAEFELHVDHRAGITKLVRLLQDYLLTQFSQNIPVVLVLDEAQNLPVSAFEQLRMIGNLEADDAKLLQIAIVGQPELRRLFASPQLLQLRQRIFRSFHLPALDRTTMEGYIKHRLSVAGSSDLEIFSHDAMDRIYEISGGLPRLINTTCDNAMLSGYSADRRKIDGPFVDSIAEQMMTIDGASTMESHSAAPRVRRPKPAPKAQARTSNPNLSLDAGALPPHFARMLESMRTQIRLEVGRITRRLSAVERGVRTTPLRATDERALRANLEPPARRSESIPANAGSASASLQRREKRLQTLSTTLQTVVRELRTLLNRCEQSGTDIKREQHRAERLCQRLSSESRRSQRIADRAAQLVHRTAPRALVEPLRTRGTQRTNSIRLGHFDPTVVLAPGAMSPREPAAAQTENLEQMLRVTRQSLDRLRLLARRSGGRPMHRKANPPKSSESKKQATEANSKPARADHNIASTSRLVEAVDSLVTLVDAPT